MLAKRYLFLALSMVPMLFAPIDASALPKRVIICEGGGWPPFAYATDDDKTQLRGVMIDVIREALSASETEVVTKVNPWKRCLREVEKGRMHIIPGASKKKKRLEKYLISDPMYLLRHGFYYQTSVFPNGPDVSEAEKIESYHIGGVQGFNYSVYEFAEESVDAAATSTLNLIDMAKAGRFDLVIGYLEVFQGLARIKNKDLSSMSYLEIPNSNRVTFHFHYPKNSDGKKLQKLINTEVSKMKADGRYRQIFLKHGVDAPSGL